MRKWGTKHFHCHSFDHLGFTRFQRNLWFWWKWLIHISFILALELKVCVSYSYRYSVFQDVGAILGNLFGKTLKMFLKCDKLVEKKTSWSLQTTQEPAIWCSRNNLELQMLKTVEMTVDRWSLPPPPPTPQPPYTQQHGDVSAVEVFRFLEIHYIPGPEVGVKHRHKSLKI